MERIGREGRWRSFKQRFRFKGMGCCGNPWGLGDSNSMNERENEEGEEAAAEEEEGIMVDEAVANPTEENVGNQECVGEIPSMNLATALEAERQFRAAQGLETVNVGTSDSASRVSLMRLLEESDGDGKEGEGGCDGLVCCVCMGRRKDAAFIPCGHTFCRVCSRELWLNRGSCPLCNRSILEVLDIF